jgi:hypothetical protein
VATLRKLSNLEGIGAVPACLLSGLCLIRMSANMVTQEVTDLPQTKIPKLVKTALEKLYSNLPLTGSVFMLCFLVLTISFASAFNFSQKLVIVEYTAVGNRPLPEKEGTAVFTLTVF